MVEFLNFFVIGKNVISNIYDLNIDAAIMHSKLRETFGIIE